MAIGASTVWEVRPTNGSNLNGGGYDSTIAGATTDYSQQDAAQLSLTDLATADGTTTTVTSVTGGFTSAMIGNALHIESGTNWETGFYFITAVTDTNTITVDRSPTSAAGSNGNGKVGGATKSFTGQTTTTLSASLVAGNTVYVKNEAWNEAVTVAVAGTAAAPITIEGYGSTRGDGTTAANRPTNNKAGSGVPFNFSQNQYNVKYLKATASATVGFTTSGSGIKYIGCIAYSNGSVGFSGGSNNTYINCEAYSNTTTGFTLSSSNNYMLGCYSHDNTTTGLTMTTGRLIAVFCIFEANGSHGVSMTTGSITAINCTFNGNTGASTDGLNGTTPALENTVYNCIFSNNGRYGASMTDGDSITANYNCFYGNATAARNNFPTGANDSTADPTFTNAASGDFSIGSNLRALGWPGAFPGGTSTGYLDIGAVQRQEPTAASSSTF